MKLTRRLLPKALQALLLVTLLGCGQATHPAQSAAVNAPAKATSLPRERSLWHPEVRSSWQWQLDSPPQDLLRVDVYDIDGFDASADLVARMHANGTHAICYIDAGTWENWRPDAADFPDSVKGKNVGGWAGEQWLDIRRLSVLEPIMTARMDMCRDKGFDAVEPDNIDGYTNDTGFPLTAADQLAYNTFLAHAAHERGLSIGLKNDLAQVPDLLPLYDWALDEQCFEYQECDQLMPFIRAGKAVFEVEYNLDTDQFCPQANAMNFNSLKKHVQLDAYRVPCR